MGNEKTNNEDTPYESYAQKIQKLRQEQEESKAPQRAFTRKMSEKRAEIAQALIRLSGNPDFKKYLEFENTELSELYVNAFGKPPDQDMALASFGEKMAFNKGRLFQMNYIRYGRDGILKGYVASLKHNDKKEN